MQRSLSSQLLALVACVGVHPGCGGADTTPSDRVAQLLEPLPHADGEGTRERFSGRIELSGGSISAREIAALPLRPRRGPEDLGGVDLERERIVVRFEAQGLAGVEGRLGLLAPRAAARQEVAHGTTGQPEDLRNQWVEIEIGPDGPQRFELPAPGPNWHAQWAIVALELEGRAGRVLAGPRSEMLSDGTRRPGARIILAQVPVERRPTRVAARRLAAPPNFDGQLSEAAWRGPGQVLLESRMGEPGGDIDTRLGGPSRVWFAWDPSFLYVAARLPDPDLYAPHERRDDPLYRDEAFEVFIAADASGRNYLEHQISPRDVVFDARFARYRKGDEGWDGDWDHRVALEGELNTRGGDRGWSVELAFPWAQLCADTDISCPPAAGMELRVNVFRLDKPDRKRQVALALSPTLEPDFHAWANAAELVLLGPEDDPS